MTTLQTTERIDHELCEKNARLIVEKADKYQGWDCIDYPVAVAYLQMRANEASLLAEAREAQHKASWLPIETAPHNEDILICWEVNPRSGRPLIALGNYESDYQEWWVSDLTLTGVAGKLVNEYKPPISPTHWMPLPTPPITNEGE